MIVILGTDLEARKMAQWAKVFTTKPADLSWIPRTHTVERIDTLKLPSDTHPHAKQM